MAPTAARAAVETAERLGAPPPPHALGWFSWADEAAGLLCARRSRDGQHSRQARGKSHGYPCSRCRQEIQGLLLGELARAGRDA